MKNNIKSVFVISALSILTAMEVVLSRFLSFSVWNQKIGLAFVAVALAGMLYGPLAGAVVGALADFVGAILFPIGAYFPGFTLTNALLGVIFGLFFSKRFSKEITYSLQLFLRVTLCAVTNIVLCTMLLNTLWISVLYGTPFKTLFLARIPQGVIMLAIQIVLLAPIYIFAGKMKKTLNNKFSKT